MDTQKQLRILVIAPTPFFADRGCHIRINEECQAIIARGHIVKILTYGLGHTVAGLDIERIHHFSFYKKTAAGPSFFKIILDGLLTLKTIRRIRSFKPDVIHAHLHEGVCIAWVARFLTGSRVPILFDAQGSLLAELRNFLRRTPNIFFSFMHLVEKWIFRVSQAIVVSSDSLRQLAHTQHLVPHNTPLLLAADSAEAAPVLTSEEKRILREQYHVPSDALTLMYCGGMTADKGTNLLYGAVLPFFATHPSLHILWIGGPEDTIRAQAVRDGFADRMTFLGSQPFQHTARLSQLGDIAIDPKPPTSSQASGKMLSYMAIALPIVTFDSANRDMIDSANFFAAPATVEGLRATILTAINTQPETLSEIGKKNRAYLQEHFSWGNTAKVLEETYVEMCARSRNA